MRRLNSTNLKSLLGQTRHSDGETELVREATDSITEIELTEEGKRDQKGIDFVHEEERVRVLHDPVRLQILQMLRDGIEDTITDESFTEATGEKLIRQRIVKRHALSVLDLIRLSEKIESYDTLTKNQIYYHLPKLIGAGFVAKYGVVTTGKRTTDYYSRTAENFVTFGLHYDPKRYQEAVRNEIASALPVFRLDMSEEQKGQLLDLIVQAEVMRLKWAGKIEDFVEEDITSAKPVEMFEWFLWVYAIGEKEYLSILQDIRKILFSGK